MQVQAHLTPYELQMLEAIRVLVVDESHNWFIGHDVVEKGWELYGAAWPGRCSPTDDQVFPLVNRFLGRLALKGFVARQDPPFYQPPWRSFGIWFLTDLGRDLLGIENTTTSPF